MFTTTTLTPSIRGLKIECYHLQHFNFYHIKDAQGGTRCTARTWPAAVRALAQCLAIDSRSGWEGLAGYRKALAALASGPNA
jgi:hypothetical protein